MYQFTTTTVINSAADINGNELWSNPTDTSLAVKGVSTFLADNVTAIYKATGYKAEMAKITVDFSDIDATTGDYYRIVLYLGVSQGSAYSIYSNDLAYKGKPLSVDFVWKSDAASTVEALVATINKYELLVYGSKILDVSYSDTYLTLEGTDEYQKLIAFSIDKLDTTAYHGTGEYVSVKSLDDLTAADSNEEVTSTAEGYFVGKESFGSYSFLLHNLRIPTDEAYRAFAPLKNEAPILGALYNQYTLYYTVNRGVLGMNAAGQNVTSTTTHVFYVNQTVSDSFESALGQIGTIIDTDPTTDGTTTEE